jgi:hypothetical protein
MQGVGTKSGTFFADEFGLATDAESAGTRLSPNHWINYR